MLDCLILNTRARDELRGNPIDLLSKRLFTKSLM
jgi:hypothetical protein